MASSPQVFPFNTDNVRTNPIQFNKGPEFYQRELGNSYLDHIVQNGHLTRFSLNGKVYELRDATANDISNVALRDGQMESLIISDESPRRRLIADAEKPDFPVGFYLARERQDRPQTLEIFYHYVSPKYREQGRGSVEQADLLLSALEMKDIDRVLAIKRQKSGFYESLDGIFSALKKSGLWYHEIDLSDREKARAIIVKKLKDLGIEPVEL